MEVCNVELARMIADGFAHTATKESVDVLRGEVRVLRGEVGEITQRLDRLERKVDQALDDKLETHERWFGQLSEKLGMKFSR